MVSALFIFIQPDLLSPVYLVERKRAGDSGSDHDAICHTGVDISMVFDSAIDHESIDSTGGSERRLGWLGIFILSLVSDLRLHDCVE